MISGVLGGFEDEWSYGEARAITFIGQTIPVGVGKIVCNKQDVAKRKGVALSIINLYKDYLWGMGSKYNPQFKKYTEVEEEEEEKEEKEKSEEEEENENAKEEEEVKDESKVEEKEQEKNETNEPKENEENEKEEEIKKDNSTEITEQKEENNGEQSETVNELSEPKNEDKEEEKEEEKKEEEEEEEGEEEKSPIQEMDDLIILSFLRALKTRVTKDQYPILASTFYFAHVLPSRPPGTNLNIKKSSYKKLSNLLEWAVEENVIETSIDKAGVIKITAVNKDHPLIRSVDTAQALKDRKGFGRTSSDDNTDDVDDGDENDGSGMMNPLVTEMYNVPKPLLPFFDGIAEDSGRAGVTRQEVSKAVSEYIRKEELDTPMCVGTQRMCALVDDKFASALGKRFNETESRLIPKKDIIEMFLGKLQPFYILNRDDIPSNERIRKGKIVPIKIEVEKSMGSKKVTIISNLESFYIDHNAFAKNLQKLIASAATVQNDNKVLALGDCTQKATTFLIRQHRVPKKYITIVKPKQHKKKK